jgi:hypothetical protein
VNRTHFTLGICGLVVLSVVTSARANDWSLSSLNPFSSPPPKRSNEPSTWTKMSQGTKNFFSRTYDVLTPWETEAEKSRAQRSRSTRPLTNTRKTSSENTSFFSGWWGAEEKPQQPRTVSEWLKQPRP